MDHVRLSNQQPLDPVRDSAYIKKLNQKEDAFFNMDKEINKQEWNIDRLSKLEYRKKAGVDKHGLPVNSMANYQLIKSMVDLHEKYTDKKFEFYIPRNKNNMVYRLPDSDPLRVKQIKRDELYALEIDALEQQFGVKLNKEISVSQNNTLVKRLNKLETTKEVYAKYDNNDVFWEKISNGEIKPWSNNEQYLFVNGLKKVALFLDKDEIRVSNKYPAKNDEEQEQCQQIIEDIEQNKQNGLLKNNNERGFMQEIFSYECDCASILIGLDKENPNSAFDISNHLGDGEGEIIINTEKRTNNPMLSKHDRSIVGGFIKGDNFSLFEYDCAKYNIDKKIKDKSIPLSLDPDQWYCFESIDDDMDISLYKVDESDIRKCLQLREEPSYLIEENGNTVILPESCITHYGEASNVKLLSYDNGEFNVTDIEEKGFGRQVFDYDKEDGFDVGIAPWYARNLLFIDTEKTSLRDAEKQVANIIEQEFDSVDYEINVGKAGSQCLVGEYRSKDDYWYHEFSELKMTDVDKSYNQNNYYKKSLNDGSERFGSLGKDIHFDWDVNHVYIVKNQEVSKSFAFNREDGLIKYNHGCYQLDSDTSKER